MEHGSNARACIRSHAAENEDEGTKYPSLGYDFYDVEVSKIFK